MHILHIRLSCFHGLVHTGFEINSAFSGDVNNCLLSTLLSFQFSSDEDHLFCTCNDKIQVVQIQTGKVVQTLREVNFIYVKCHVMMLNVFFLQF